MEPASTIIEKLGGVAAVARLTGVHRTRVSNWKRPRADGGTGGRIPQSHHVTLLRAARENGIEDISAESFLQGDAHDGEAA